MVLRKGKHNIRIIKLVSDAEWARSGKTYPGESKQGGAPEEVDTSNRPVKAKKVRTEGQGQKKDKAKKSFWSQFAPPVDPNEQRTVIRTVGTRPDFAQAAATQAGQFTVRRPTVVGNEGEKKE